MKRDAQFVKAVDVPYPQVRDRLRDDPASVFHPGAAEGRIAARLVAHLRGTAVARDIEIEIVAFDEPSGLAAGAHLMFRADASRHPDLFPHLEGRLDAVPVSATRTALFLIATYKPPLGVVGGAADALVLHRFAEESLSGLLDAIAGRLERS
jgi:hypothetical protein